MIEFLIIFAMILFVVVEGAAMLVDGFEFAWNNEDLKKRLKQYATLSSDKKTVFLMDDFDMIIYWKCLLNCYVWIDNNNRKTRILRFSPLEREIKKLKKELGEKI